MSNNQKQLYAIGALFDSPDKIIYAANKIREAGFVHYDVNTPYPIHGMDKAMGLKSSKIGYVTLFAGFFGASFILSFMWWTLSVSYPLVIGGKPYFPLPAFVPITFEFTVLSAVVSTAIALIAVAFNFPYNSHPLHDSYYMKNVSSDKFGIVIEAIDEKFKEEDTENLLKSLGAYFTELIYKPEEKTFKIFEPKFLAFLLIIALITSGSTYVTLNKLMYLPPFDFMLHQKRGNAQARSNFFYNTREMRNPVKGTVAQSYIPYPFNATDSTEYFADPLLPTMEVLKLGQKKFLTFCSPCHGNYADGNSRLQGQFPPGPTLHSQKVINYSDGKIYNIITNGQNVMPSYASQITSNERWAIINYIRVLQRAQNPKPEDFSAIKEIKKENDDNASN